MFIQQSTEYIQQIEAEIERLQQLRDQMQATIQSEKQLENEELPAPCSEQEYREEGRRQEGTGEEVAAKKRGRPKAESSAA